MVLSKVDPFDGAFPVPGSGSVVPTAGQYMQPSELNLTQSFTQPQIIQAKKIVTQPDTKKNPFKAPEAKSPASAGLGKKSLSVPRKVSKPTPAPKPDEPKYGANFKIPELPPIL